MLWTWTELIGELEVVYVDALGASELSHFTQDTLVQGWRARENPRRLAFEQLGYDLLTGVDERVGLVVGQHDVEVGRDVHARARAALLLVGSD